MALAINDLSPRKRERAMSTTKDAAYQEFLNGLEMGDKVLVCHEDDEAFGAALVGESGNGWIKICRNFWPYLPFHGPDTFSAKTGKARGAPFFLHPCGDVDYQEHIAKEQALRQQAEQERVEHQRAKRNALLLAVSGATAEGIEYERLERLSTSDLETLNAILGKLRGE